MNNAARIAAACHASSITHNPLPHISTLCLCCLNIKREPSLKIENLTALESHRLRIGWNQRLAWKSVSVTNNQISSAWHRNLLILAEMYVLHLIHTMYRSVPLLDMCVLVNVCNCVEQTQRNCLRRTSFSFFFFCCIYHPQRNGALHRWVKKLKEKTPKCHRNVSERLQCAFTQIFF